jgi:hypothetical protein
MVIQFFCRDCDCDQKYNAGIALLRSSLASHLGPASSRAFPTSFLDFKVDDSWSGDKR